MTWTQTHSGKIFTTLAPQVGMICLDDIAESLSKTCRFNGHCEGFYSVAQHSLNVSKIVSPENALWGLLHDAAETYLSDVPSPVKPALITFKTIESMILEKIAEAFQLQWPMPDEIKHADDIALATEKHYLMKPEPRQWKPLPPPLLTGELRGIPHDEVCQLFKLKFADLWLEKALKFEPFSCCPRCTMPHDDQDSLGVVYCVVCGYCAHPSSTDGICAICSAKDDEGISGILCPPENHIEGGY